MLAALLILGLGACGNEAGLDDADGIDDGAAAAEGLDDDSIGQIEHALTSVSIGNAGFESDWSGWTRVGWTGLSDIAHSGSQSAKVSSSTGQVKRTVSGLKGGTSYVLSAYVKGHARVGVRDHGGSTVSKPINASTWTQVSVSFKTGSSNTSAEVFASWVSGGDARVDSFSLGSEDTDSTGDCAYPAQLLDVSNWKLQLPTGSPTIEIKNPTLAEYTSTYFRTNPECTGVRFRAHTSGTTTPGAEFPRSELRELRDNGDKAKWSTSSGTHRMIIEQAVTRLPDGKRAIGVGQIHNGSNDILIIRVEGSELLIKPNGSNARVLDSNYSMGKRFKVELVASGGYIKVYYNGSSSPALSLKKSSSTAYFKAGAYTQSNCSTEDDYGEDCGSDNYGEVEIYDLVIRHQ